MTYFNEKDSQISVDSLQAFGIDLSTRYARAGEMAEMLEFAELVAEQGHHPMVTSAFYDSKAYICTFGLVEDLDPLSDTGEAIKQCAIKAISQFEWDGTVYHGRQD
ncbi:MAG: hypothetical protein WBF84_12735 [Castellaniella sp.]|uniref:hypothetical protein n=1 Tax=Castellaniella sp. TaxID=1955812 RepID=UPI003C733096